MDSGAVCPFDHEEELEEFVNFQPVRKFYQCPGPDILCSSAYSEYDYMTWGHECTLGVNGKPARTMYPLGCAFCSSATFDAMYASKVGRKELRKRFNRLDKLNQERALLHMRANWRPRFHLERRYNCLDELHRFLDLLEPPAMPTLDECEPAAKRQKKCP